MRIQPIENTNFKCHQKTIVRNHFEKTVGIFKGSQIDILSKYDSNKLAYKLYYVTDKLGNWVKSKLKFYTGGKCYKTMWGKKR